MAITWGAYSGHMRVGIDVRHGTPGPSTTDLTVSVDFYIGIDSTWDFDDGQRMDINGSGIGSGEGWNFTNNLGPNQTKLIGTRTFNDLPISYGGGPTYSWRGTISGHYAGSTPTHVRSYTLPARPPSAPSQPGLTVSNVTADAASFTIGVPASNGDAIDDYDIQIDNNSDFSSVNYTLDGNGTQSGLAPATTYYARARAHNSVGYSSWSTVRSFTTGAEVPSAPTGLTVSAITPTGATADWNAPGTTGGSAILDYDVQFATNSGFTSGVQNFTGIDPTDFTATTLLSGTPYWVRVRARNGVGYSAYTAAVSFTTLTGTPLIVTPAEGSQVTTGIASAVIEAQGVVANQRLITVEFSQDATFATGVLTATMTPATVAANNRYTVTDATKYLKTGTWYVRAKVTNNSSGYVTPWSAIRTFTQEHTPTAAIITPSVGKTIKYAATTTFDWTFTDPAGANDVQTAYQVVVENNATAEVVYDSTKVTSPDTVITVALAAALKNVTLRWRVRVWDQGDTPSAWTGYTIFTLSDPPVVTISEPGPGVSIATGAPTFSWINSIPSGGSQARAELNVYQTDNNELVWSTIITGSATSVTPPIVILRNLQNYYFTLKVTDTADLSTTVTQNFSTSYNTPGSIAYSVDAADVDELGFVNIDWSEANPDSLFAMWKVYRKVPLGEWQLLATIPDQNTRHYYDYLVIAGNSYEYSVTQVATRSGVLLESSVGYYIDSNGDEVSEDRLFTMDLGYYWIINPDNPGLSTKLPNVTGDDSTLEFEDSSYTIIGRGRHRDYGDELGYSGTITCQSREYGRPNIFRIRMEELRRTKETYYLRTPFGRLFPIAIGNLSWTPVAGTGTAEMGDMSIPYEEVR